MDSAKSDPLRNCGEAAYFSNVIRINLARFIMSKRFAFGPQAAIQSLTQSNLAPEGTSIHVLNLGYLRLDESFVRSAGNVWTKSGGVPAKYAVHTLQMYAVLIDHPSDGLILWDTGPGLYDTYEESWDHVCEVFVPTNRDRMQSLDKAIESAGYNIKDVRHVIISHLHLDHAGGLQYFKGRDDVKIWAHEIELKHAFWAACTDSDSGYLPYYLDMGLKWETFSDQELDIFPGITLHLSPGHAPGLIWLQINLRDAGTVIFTSDHVHIKENYELGHPQGWLLTGMADWYRSSCRLRMLQRLTNATVVFGHDIDTLDRFAADNKGGKHIT